MLQGMHYGTVDASQHGETTTVMNSTRHVITQKHNLDRQGRIPLDQISNGRVGTQHVL